MWLQVHRRELAEQDDGAVTRFAAEHDAPIFEATFEHDGVLVRCDVIAPDGWRMAEVKSAGGAKDYHRGDLATQIWVTRGAGLPLSGAAIRHVDTAFVLEREGDWRGDSWASHGRGGLTLTGSSLISAQRKAVEHARQLLGISERRACSIFSVDQIAAERRRFG